MNAEADALVLRCTFRFPDGSITAFRERERYVCMRPDRVGFAVAL